MSTTSSPAVIVAGRNPTKMSIDELRAAGFEPRSPLQAIRAHYLQKHRGDPGAVLADADVSSLLWPYRLGRDPFAHPKSTSESRARRTLALSRARAARAAKLRPGGSSAPAAPAPPA